MIRSTFCLAVCAAALTAAAHTTPAAAEPGPTLPLNVTLVEAGGTHQSQSISVGQLESNGCPKTTEQPAQYLPDGQQESASEVNWNTNSWTLADVLSECLAQPIQLASITSLLIDRENREKGPEQLSLEDLQAPSDFLDNAETPLIWTDGTNLYYARPRRSETDENSTDQLQEAAGEALPITVFTGPPLLVKAQASADSIAPGGKVTFTASVQGGVPDVSYSWFLDNDTGTQTGQSVTGTFPLAGNYDVVVYATDSAGGGGAQELTITAGAPKPGPANNGHGNKRGTGSGGTRNDNGDNGSSDGSSPNQSHPTPGSGTASGTTAVASSTAQTPGGASASSRGAGTTSSGSTPTPPPTSGPAPSANAANRVTGFVIGSLDPVSAKSSPLLRAISRSEARSPFTEPTNLGAIGALLAALAVLMPIGLGAGRELRRIRSSP